MKVPNTTGTPPCQLGMPMGAALTPPLGVAAAPMAVPEAPVAMVPTEGAAAPTSITSVAPDTLLDKVRRALDIKGLYSAYDALVGKSPYLVDILGGTVPPPPDRQGTALMPAEERQIAQFFIDQHRNMPTACTLVVIAACMTMTPAFLLNAFKEAQPGSPLWFRRVTMNLIKLEEGINILKKL